MTPRPYCSEHPGCWLQDAALSELQGVGVPEHPVDHTQPA